MENSHSFTNNTRYLIDACPGAVPIDLLNRAKGLIASIKPWKKIKLKKLQEGGQGRIKRGKEIETNLTNKREKNAAITFDHIV